ncbi:MAG TPA: sulfite exporter TauE/SafE family protein [Solirubrobacteraceae bacterium]|nr:sulfite exporter TauE/SafE family protein [Solirubrobacteraceae bacterium]
MTALAIAAGAAVMAGAALQSATGFGFALVSAPLLFAATTPEQAIGLLLLLGLEVNLLTLATEGRRPEPLRSDAARLLAWSLPGVAAGLVALRSLDATTLQVGVTIGVFATLAVRHVANRRRAEAPHEPRWWAVPAAGLASGALTTSTNTAGPPIVLYLLARGARPVETRDTLTVTFVGLSLIGAAALAVSGTSGAVPGAAALAALVPLTLLGHLAGRPVFAHLAEDRYEPVLTAVLVVAAVGGLLSALA